MCRWVNNMSKKKKVNKKIKKKKLKIVFFLFLVLIAVFLLVSFKTDIFNISSVIVNGNEKLSSDQVIKASGCIPKENIFRVSTSEMEKRLMMQPYIKDAKIKRRLPNKIKINIAERKEKMILPYVGSYLYLDNEGFVLDIKTSKEKNKIPTISGLDIEEPKRGSSIELKSGESFDKIESFIELCDKLNIYVLFANLDFTDKDNISIDMKNGIKVAFGPLNNVKYKLSYLNSIINDINKKGIICKQVIFNKGENPIIVTDNK